MRTYGVSQSSMGRSVLLLLSHVRHVVTAPNERRRPCICRLASGARQWVGHHCELMGAAAKLPEDVAGMTRLQTMIAEHLGGDAGKPETRAGLIAYRP